MHIYIYVGVSLLHFKYPTRLKKLYWRYNNINYIFPNYVSEQNISDSIKKKKANNFIVVVTLLNFPYTFQCVFCISCHVKIFCHFLGGWHLFGDPFSFLWRTLYNI